MNRCTSGSRSIATHASRSAMVRGRRRRRGVLSSAWDMDRIARSVVTANSEGAGASAATGVYARAPLRQRRGSRRPPIRAIMGAEDPALEEVRLAQPMSPDDAVRLIPDGAVVAISSSSGLNTPDRVVRALGERFAREGRPRALTTVHPIGTGDM